MFGLTNEEIKDVVDIFNEKCMGLEVERGHKAQLFGLNPQDHIVVFDKDNNCWELVDAFGMFVWIGPYLLDKKYYTKLVDHVWGGRSYYDYYGMD